MLSHLPLVFYIRFPGSKFNIDKDLPEDVYPMFPKNKTWIVNKYTGVKAKRFGFYWIPDFASTADMIQGQTLDAVFCHAISQQIRAYVGCSRVRKKTGIWLLESFAPSLFMRGCPKGPRILMEKLQSKKKHAAAAAKAEFDGSEDVYKDPADVVCSRARGGEGIKERAPRETK